MLSVFRFWQRLARNAALFGVIVTISVGIAVLTQHKAIADAPVDQGKHIP